MMKRALISVYDKSGIVKFAKALEKLGWEIISTGGTFDTLKRHEIDVKEVSDLTGAVEILNGRVKTLHPKVHGGILYKRDDEDHLKTIEEMEIPSIDMIVNNLYPFEETVKREDVSHEEIIENIDIGGPTMLRSGAKNYKDVTVVLDPADYERVLVELENNGDTSIKTRQYLARKVFNYVAYYDVLISNYFNQLEDEEYPEYFTLGYKEIQELRYGENPHQKAKFYGENGGLTGTLNGAKQLHGKELSFNNINDANGALMALKEFDGPTVVAVKHANPCGIGSAENIYDAYIKAYDCDPVSIFGGIVAINREVEKNLAEKLNEIFLEVIMAPSFTEEALEILQAKKNIRLLLIDDIEKNDYTEKDMKKVLGGLLVQDRDDKALEGDMKIVTERKPSEAELKDLKFAWRVAKVEKSNGVTLVKNGATIAIGQGEVNRIWAVENSIDRAGEKIQGAVLASDGFFPFSDSIEALEKAGIKAIIQPGGSIRDEEVIEAANKADIAMIFTGVRHFKH